MQSTDYQSCTISELRSLLAKKGGTPANKNKATLIDELLKIESGEYQPVRNNRGRPSGRIQQDIEVEDDDRQTDFSDPQLDSDFESKEFEPKEEVVTGILELNSEGYGFIRVSNFDTSVKDAFIARPTIKRFFLREGDKVTGKACSKRENKLPEMTDVMLVNDEKPKFVSRPRFDDLTPYYPNSRITLGLTGEVPLRIIDLFCPIGKGQRGLVVAPPKTGKTTLLKRIAQSVEKFHPEIHLMVLLVDERPEEVTDFKSCVKGEVISSTFDQTMEHHLRLSELCFKRGKALVEAGKDVLILMDSITKLTRACNVSVPASGKLLSGGIDPAALQTAKKFFGLARNTEAGSLTIISTALIDTGSRLDDIVFEEFKGTGNMEITLSRTLAEKRIFPAIDILKSGTRKDEYLLSDAEISCADKIRRKLSNDERATETIIGMMEKTKNNDDLISKADGWLNLMK